MNAARAGSSSTPMVACIEKRDKLIWYSRAWLPTCAGFRNRETYLRFGFWAVDPIPLPRGLGISEAFLSPVAVASREQEIDRDWKLHRSYAGLDRPRIAAIVRLVASLPLLSALRVV